MTTRLRYHLVLKNSGFGDRTTWTSKRGRVALRLRETKWQEATLSVFYIKDDKVVNENHGIYNNCDEALSALRVFTEPELLEILE